MLGLFTDVSALRPAHELPAGLSGKDRLDSLLELAWYQRQSDSAASLERLGEAMALAGSLSLPAAGEAAARCVESLIRAEQYWLEGQLERADAFMEEALRRAPSAQDPVLMGHYYWLLAFLSDEHGQSQFINDNLDKSAACYREGGAATETLMAQARQIFMHSFGDPPAAKLLIERCFPDGEKNAPDVLCPWILTAIANINNMMGNPGLALECHGRAFGLFLKTGQIRSSLISANNTSVCYEELGEHDTSLEWSRKSLELALKTEWPGMVGMAQARTGNVLRYLGRHETARTSLENALASMGKLQHSHNYGVVLRFLGELALAMKDHGAALDWYQRLIDHALPRSQTDLLLPALRGKAEALAALDMTQESLAAAAEALKLAETMKDKLEQINALHLHASISKKNQALAGAEPGAPGTSLYYLDKALKIAATIPDYSVPAGILDDLAAAQARAGDWRSAYGTALLAGAERNKQNTIDAGNRAIALQIKHESDKAKAETEYLRRQAEIESQKAQALQKTAQTLETLGLIGRELTATLDSAAVCIALHNHVHQLLDATTFFVYMLEPDGLTLRSLFFIENGEPMDMPIIEVTDDSSNVARCARERRDIVKGLDQTIDDTTLIPGSLFTRSLLYSPLMTGDRLLGVISIQTVKKDAYGERECAIFRTLCSYAAIALGNAETYKELADANERIRQDQDRLVATEKMASLGRLTAGIAHEINTPLASIRSSLDELYKLALEYEASIGEASVSPDDHRAIASDMKRALELAGRAGDKAAGFIRSIKTQTRQSETQDKIRFDIVSVARDALLLLDFLMRPKQVLVEWVGAEKALYVVGDPGKFSQVVTNLVTNAVDALPQAGGRITMGFAARERSIILSVRDNGSGIDPSIASRMFDPLFTTKRFGESTGLGLPIARDIVHGNLRGSITFQSEPGKGTVFHVEIPAIGA